MSFWKKKKYCPYCGSELNANGSCPNKNCIKYNTASTSTTNTITADSQNRAAVYHDKGDKNE